MPHYHIDIWRDESIWSWAGKAENEDEAQEAAREQLNDDWGEAYESWDALAEDMDGTALLYDTKTAKLEALKAAVAEMLDNRDEGYLHSEDREMLLVALTAA